MTLIEIVVGLVILGTILASLAIARGRFARQWAAADRKLTATRALDSLITGWMERPLVPVNRQGPLPDAKNFTWRTRAVRAPDPILQTATIRVEVFDGEKPRDDAPVLSVDLLVHAVPRTSEAR